ncbi:hypothetical protein [Aliikangiella maris]
MKHCLIKKSVIAFSSILALQTGTLTAQSDNFERAQKELKIMSKIFDTSLAEQHQNKAAIYGSKNTEATYLAKQGMVFSFNFSKGSFDSINSWEDFGEGIGHFVEAVASEVGNAIANIPDVSIPHPPQPISPTELEMDEVEQFEAYQEHMEMLERLRERNHVQREKVRDLQREIRSLEREKLHFESRKENESAVNNEKIKAMKVELQKQVDKLNQEMESYKKSMQEYRDKRSKKRTENIKRKTDIIFSTLCDYGATLRSLNKGEYVTIIFKNFQNNEDKIHVFDYSDIKSCNSKDNLLRSATTYQL